MKILIIRRDNIGDLVCTLPLIHRLREQYPQAWIGALVTHYNQEVLHCNPDINNVFSYKKNKHLEHTESALRAMWQRTMMLWKLRQMKLDLVILPASGVQKSARRMARLLCAKRIIAADDGPIQENTSHEVEHTANILHILNLPATQLPPAKLVPNETLQAKMRENLAKPSNGLLLGLHISSRKPSQRWPVDRFIALIEQLHAKNKNHRFILFWSPGDENNPLHPGDDGKAKKILQTCQHLPLSPCPTSSLAELIAGLSLLDAMVCSDGGHMHLAAGVGKPLVCLFGHSDAARWHPWGVPYELLQPTSQNVEDVTVEQVIEALQKLPVQIV